jgi:hypothetical protein
LAISKGWQPVVKLIIAIQTARNAKDAKKGFRMTPEERPKAL